ncbi:MAG: MauE/DoxX family redox-associated membrane protein [Actinomycetes bacterium]
MLGVIASVILGGVMCVAGGSKIAMGNRWPVEAQALGAPKSIAPIVPWIEIALGALLIVQLKPEVVGGLSVALLVAFTLLIMRQLQIGHRPVCACFGSWSSKPLSWQHVARNVGFIALAVITIVV